MKRRHEEKERKQEIYARKDFRGPTVEDGWLGLFLACAALLLYCTIQSLVYIHTLAPAKEELPSLDSGSFDQ